MAKKVAAKIKLQIPAAQANPAPPVGPALGQHSVNIMEFCKAFNERTKELNGTIVPVVIRPVVQFHNENAAGSRAAETCSQLGKSFRRTQPQQSGRTYPGPDPGNRRDQDARS